MRRKQTLISNLVEVDREASWDQLRDQFDSMVQQSPDLIATALGAARDDLSAGRYPAGVRPYVHTNGFTKLLLADLPTTQSRITLHYWPERIAVSESHVSRPHNHRFAFSSVLIMGRQNFIEFSDGKSEEGSYKKFEYWPYLRGRFARIRYDSEVELVQQGSTEREQLQGVYHLNELTVHSAETATQAPCATIVLRGPHVRRSANVYYKHPASPGRVGVQLGRSIRPHDMENQIIRILRVL
jgi:hypothetical protein